MPCKPCTFDYSTGNGDGVASAIGNWGFSNEVANPGNELNRIVCLFKKMDALKEPPKGGCCQPKKSLNKPNCQVPCKTVAKNCCTPRVYPLITYNGVSTTFFSSSRRVVHTENSLPCYGRHSVYRDTDKIYKLGPLCCPQPCCPAPVCPQFPIHY